MELFIDWISTNWQWVASVGASLLYFILLLIFRRTKLVDNSLLYHLVNWVNLAELKFSDGDDKKTYVIEKAKAYLGESFNYSQVSSLIEWILTSPQKKGGK